MTPHRSWARSSSLDRRLEHPRYPLRHHQRRDRHRLGQQRLPQCQLGRKQRRRRLESHRLARGDHRPQTGTTLGGGRGRRGQQRALQRLRAQGARQQSAAACLRAIAHPGQATGVDAQTGGAGSRCGRCLRSGQLSTWSASELATRLRHVCRRPCGAAGQHWRRPGRWRPARSRMATGIERLSGKHRHAQCLSGQLGSRQCQQWRPARQRWQPTQRQAADPASSMGLGDSYIFQRIRKSANTANASKATTWNSTFSGTATYTGSGYSGGAVLLDQSPATRSSPHSTRPR